MTSTQSQRKNGLENAAKMFTANKINPEDNRNIREVTHIATSTADSLNNAQNVTSFMGRRK